MPKPHPLETGQEITFCQNVFANESGKTKDDRPCEKYQTVPFEKMMEILNNTDLKTAYELIMTILQPVKPYFDIDFDLVFTAKKSP